MGPCSGSYPDSKTGGTRLGGHFRWISKNRVKGGTILSLRSLLAAVAANWVIRSKGPKGSLSTKGFRLGIDLQQKEGTQNSQHCMTGS